jgi:hypothetical protein
LSLLLERSLDFLEVIRVLAVRIGTRAQFHDRERALDLPAIRRQDDVRGQGQPQGQDEGSQGTEAGVHVVRTSEKEATPEGSGIVRIV